MPKDVIAASIGPINPTKLPVNDWLCECGAINISKRTQCKTCNAPQPSTDTDSYAKNSKIFKACDWRCTNKSCGNINWDWRDSCNVCGTLKPEVALQVAKKREFERALRRPEEGRGGGFYDRQDPQDKVNHDSDGEAIDDFGRRKRKRVGGALGSDAKTKEQLALDRLYSKKKRAIT